MILQLLIAASTFCNPMSIPDMPVGLECRAFTNGSPVSALEPGWRRAMWNGRKSTIQYRELADPMIFVEDGRWYLYPSCGLLWTSEDCGGTWKHVPIVSSAEYAPSAVKFRGRYYLAMSHGPLEVGDSPTGPFKKLGNFDFSTFGEDPQMPRSPGDPFLYAEGDRIFLYWGCCNRPKAIWGVELDPENPLVAKSPAQCFVDYDPKTYPWHGAVEGAFLFKRGETYYLCYSGRGTGSARYDITALKGQTPLGPFTHQKNNPFFETPKGVVTGTGHGCIFKDDQGEYWVCYCVLVGRYHLFERMIGMDRITFDANGDLSVSHATDTPQWLPSSGKKGATGWKALKAACSEGEVCDGALKTFHVYESCPATVEYSFGSAKKLRAYRLIWRDYGLDARRGVVPGPYRYCIERRENGKWTMWFDASANDADLTVDYRECSEVTADAVRLVILSCPSGMKPAVTEFTVFGEEGVR